MSVKDYVVLNFAKQKNHWGQGIQVFSGAFIQDTECKFMGLLNQIRAKSGIVMQSCDPMAMQ